MSASPNVGLPQHSGDNKEVSSRSRKLGRGGRHRAPRACLCCRARKVRCDVAYHGSPCTNCTFDRRECTVPRRKRDWTPKQHEMLRRGQPQPNLVERPDACDQDRQDVGTGKAAAECGEGPKTDEFKLDQLFDMDAYINSLTIDKDNQPSFSAEDKDTRNTPASTNIIQTGSPGTCSSVDGLTTKSLPSDAFSPNLFDPPLQLKRLLATIPKSSRLQSSIQRQVAKETSFVPFSSYHFVSASTIWNLDQADTKYLEKRGCLHLPDKPALDEFVQEYFLHVHPVLPLIDEGGFWAMYNSRPGDDAWSGHFPLVILQAMIFIACPFVAMSTLQDLGFASVQEARSVFYSVSKILFHADEHRDDVCSAQAALMLTYYAPTIYDRTNSYWLSTAIHFAKMGGADQYHMKEIDHECKITLKRLWWGCILRDRIMALSLRRPLQIKPDDFDFSQPGLLEDDLNDEIHRSEVYDAATKRELIQLMTSLCELAVAMNDMLMFCFPTGPKLDAESSSQRLRDSFLRLDEWHVASVAKLQVPPQSTGVHGSLTLFVNAIYIYYYTAKAILNHCLEDLATKGLPGSNLYERWHASGEVADSLQSITNKFIELKKRDLARYLPNTFVAFSLLPLAWRMSQPGLGGHERPSKEEEEDLSDLCGVVKGLGNLYEMTDSALECVGVENE